MKKNFKKILLIIIFISFFSVVCNCFTLKAKGLVSQGYYNGGELHYYTLTAPHDTTITKYAGSTFTKENEPVNIGKGTSFVHKRITIESKWVMFSKNQHILTGDPTIAGVFSSYKIVFHKNKMANYGGICSDSTKQTCYRYATMQTAHNFKDLSSLSQAYTNLGNNTTTYDQIGNNSNYTEVASQGEDSLYRMTLANRGGNKPVYVAERKIPSSIVSTLKNNLGDKDGYKNAIYVSSMLHVATKQGELIIENANNPKQFMALGVDGKVTWDVGTRGWNNTNKLGSVLNLFDNILQFPTDNTRTIIVKHINIGANDNINTDNVKKGTSTSEYYTMTANDTSSYTKKDNYGEYIGLNSAKSSTMQNAQNTVASQVSSGHYRTDTSITINRSAESNEQYVYIEMYYKSNEEIPLVPPTTKEDSKVIERHIQYYTDGVVKSIIEKDPQTIEANKEMTFYKDDSYGTYLGYSQAENDSSVPIPSELYNPSNSVTITASNIGTTIFINFGYSTNEPSEIKVIIRDIFYYYNNAVKSYTLRLTDTITRNKTYSKLPNIDHTDYEYVGYLISYDKELPSCNAYVTDVNCNIDKNAAARGIYINFMYKEKQKPTVPHSPPEPIIGGNLGIRTSLANVYTTCYNTKAGFPKYNGTIVRSVASGENMDIGMENLKKYYIGGINIESEEHEEKLTKNIALIKLVKVWDVNDNSVKNHTIGLEILQYIIPYKHIMYKLNDFSIYSLKSSKIYAPTYNEKAKGAKIIDEITDDIFYSLTDKIDLKVKNSNAGSIDLTNMEVRPRLIVASNLTEKKLNEGIIETVGKLPNKSIGGEGSTVYNFAADFNLFNILNIDGLLSDVNTIIEGINNLHNYTIHGYILETINAYTNISDDLTIFETFWRTLYCLFMGYTDESCPDFWDLLVDGWKYLDSRNKIGVFVYTGLDNDGKKEHYIEKIQTGLINSTIGGYPGLGRETLKKLDTIRKLDIKVKLKTKEYNSILELEYNAKIEKIGQSITMFGFVDNFFEKAITIWDINFKKEDNVLGNILEIANIFNGSFNIRKYKFNGFVNVFTEASGMRINSLGKEYYTKGFGDDIGDLDTASSLAYNITYNTYKSILAKQKIDIGTINGRRSFAEKTKYQVETKKGNSSFEDNFYYSNLNALGIKNKFSFTNSEKTKEHNSEEGTADLINVYTPIEIDDDINIESDDKLISQLTDKSTIPDAFFNSKFSFDIGVGEYSNGKYTMLNAINLKDYCDGFFVKFSFKPEYIEIEKTSGDIEKRTSVGIDRFEYFKLDDYRLTPDNKLRITVKALNEITGSVYITARAVAKNLFTDSNIKADSLSKDYVDFFKAYYNICNDMSFDISKVDAPVYYDEKEFEITSNDISRLYDFRITDVKDVNWKNVFRESNSSINHNGVAYYVGLKKWDKIKGMTSRNESEVGKYLNRTLPIAPYKHTDGTYVSAPKIGYRIAFDVKKTYPAANNNDKHDVIIDVDFFYLKKDGSNIETDIDLYYKNNSEKYVKIATKDDIHYDDGYKIYCTPNEKDRLLDIGDTEDLSLQTISIGTLKKLTLKYDQTTTKSSTHQTFYGEYKLPNSTIVVKKGGNPNKKSDILSDGYLGVKFEISSYFKFAGEAGKRTITYQQDMDEDNIGTNQWLYEGYMGQKYGAGVVDKVIRLEKGKIKISNYYKDIEGTVVLFDIDNRAANDYE